MEKYLNNLKTEYLKTEPNLNFRLNGFTQIESKLENREPHGFLVFRRYALAITFVLVFAVLSFGSFKVVEAALPGTTLYPVKILSEKIINKVSGNNQISIDNRAKEIITLTKEDKENSDEIKSTVKEYTKNVEEAPQRNEPIFQEKLNEDNVEFKKALEESPKSANDLKEAINATSQISDKQKDGGDQKELNNKTSD